MAWPGDRVQHMVIAKLSLRLSLEGKLPQNFATKTTESEREREKERKKETKERKKE